jgi:hypothetical protein
MLLQYVYAFVLYSYLLVTAVTLVFGRPSPRERHLQHSLGARVTAPRRRKPAATSAFSASSYRRNTRFHLKAFIYQLIFFSFT